MRPLSSGGLRLVEPLAALSMATDLARGQPAEQALRACMVATALAEVTGLRGEDASRVFYATLYATLLRFIGCTATSHDYAVAFGGDDVVVRAAGDLMDPTDPSSAGRGHDHEGDLRAALHLGLDGAYARGTCL